MKQTPSPYFLRTQYIAALLFVQFFVQMVQAQVVERSLTGGFSTSVSLVRPYDPSSWLIAGRGEPAPGATYQDTLFIAVIGHDGQIDLRKNIKAYPSEVHYWHDVLALPDGGILATFESTLCDVGADILTIQRLDYQGNLVWEKSGGFFIGTTRPPEKWFVNIDGDLLGTAYNQIWKVDSETGDVIWKADLEGTANGVISPSFFEIIPGSEDFIALGNPDFQIWKKTGDPIAPTYILQNSLELPGYRNRLTRGPGGWFYCFQNFPVQQFERFNILLQVETLPIAMGSVDAFSFGVGSEGIFLNERSFSHVNRFRKFDLLGQNEVEYPAPSSWYTFGLIATQNWVVFGGTEAAGDTTWDVFSGGPAQSSAAWIRSFPAASPASTFESPNAAVTAVEQQSLIATSSFPGSSFYNISGGDFRIKVSNLGNTPIQTVSLNTSFNRSEFSIICYYFPAQQKTFSNLNLAPGESIWLDFGDVTAFGQAVIPDEICFWTSSPNEMPDAVHEDDRACQPANYTVAVNDPNIPQIILAPNPADDFTTLNFSENRVGERWQIFDALGRVVAQGICTENSALRLETNALPNGFYLVQVGEQVGKLIVRH